VIQHFITFLNNGSRYIGDGTDDYVKEPVKIMDNVSAVQTNGSTTFALKTDGTLWAWGRNSTGLMGDGTRTVSSPIPVYFTIPDILRLPDEASPGDSQDNESRYIVNADRAVPHKIIDDVISFSLGERHAMAVKSDGSLWGWGSRSSLMIGNISNNPSTESSQISDEDAMLWNGYELIPIRILGDVKHVVVAGHGATFAIRNDNSLWGWGDIRFDARTGAGNVPRYLYTPVKIMDDVARVYPGRSNTFAVKKDGSLWGWGSNYFGMMGNGERSNRMTGDARNVFSPVKILDEVAFVSADSQKFMMVIRNDGSLWSWGHNWSGELGRGTKGMVLESVHAYFSPYKIMEDIVYVTSGGGFRDYTVAIKNDGTLWTWGEWALADRINIYKGSHESSTGTPTMFMDLPNSQRYLHKACCLPMPPTEPENS